MRGDEGPEGMIGLSGLRGDGAPDEDVIKTLFKANYGSLVRMCFLLCGDPGLAEDLAQEAFVRAASKILDLSPPQARAYLRRTAINLWRSRLRRFKAERRARSRAAPLEIVPAVSIEDRDMLWRTVLGLPRRQRACLVLRFYEDLTEKETARVLGCSVGTVKSNVSDALRWLRSQLETGGEAGDEGY